MRLIKLFCLVSALACGLGLAGCASLPEKILHAKYRETYDAVYEAPDTTDATARFDGNSTFDDYLQYAFAHSPGLRAAFDRWKAALERIPQARSLDDPTLSFEYFIEQRQTRYQASLTQVFPAFGKLNLRDKRVASEAEAAMHAFEAERFELFDRVVKAFYEYHYLLRATEVTDEDFQLLVDIEKVVTTRYQAGLAPFSDLIKAQVEIDRVANELASLRDERGSKSALLVALLNLPARAALPWPKVSSSGRAIINEAVLAGMLADLNPELKAADSIITAAVYREKLAHRSFLPDLMLGASWMVMPGMDGKGDESDVGIMAGITVPVWWGKYRAEIREAGAMIRAAVNARDDRRNMLKAELSMAIFKFRDAERRIALFTTSLIPKATQALEVAKQEFASGKTDFMTLIDAQRTLLEFRLMAERAAADREITLGEIGCCIGMYDVGGGLEGKTPGKKK
ncbi:MAG: TolC family protein [Verrucomicrobia bacterium]|nr:TolC family protein [Verrucomicrobiota bacterium]MCG2680155.1 TolC family protein [Kiritimatiellia bacterium]MBU4247064.1 TolC family protein [Verrucomicrobiota bacterium]MBU4291138.1 TolC family protein [Verrucomicrobiota bacterium]MBU4428012.1 TolC family protein [Verrucomicrobiota bacterium]